MITSPTLLLDKRKCLKNIESMAAKAKRNGIIFRPHFKTHQSLEVGRWFKDFGVDKITVSSMQMAAYFATDGWNDITVAFPVNVLEHELISELGSKITLNIQVESADAVHLLAQKVRTPLQVYIKIDVGTQRTGIPFSDFGRIDDTLNSIKEYAHFQFCGFITHTGHSYQARSSEEVMNIHLKSMDFINQLKDIYVPQYPNLILSTGDTPTCSVADDFLEIDEIRPGNFVFYDWMQHIIGACHFDQIAMVMACPVVAIHPNRQEFVVHGGAVHLSKDFIFKTDGSRDYGRIVSLANNGWSSPWEQSYVTALSQEHGIIRTTSELLKQIKVGDLIGIVPIHSCLSVSAMRTYLTLEGKSIQCMGY
ncbi:alanine racemase [Algivirga pacifica]|uniref:DSD1 family PLP-dependent enzyme n=1 Tax=Algivirga pacifica TaxID=1162670 RepID=A0ABP9DGK3_9BACT